MTTAVAILALVLFATLGAPWCRAQDRRLDQIIDDAAADEEWRSICAAYGTTPEDMRARDEKEQSW